jgi:hypothetical protein
MTLEMEDDFDDTDFDLNPIESGIKAENMIMIAE